MDTTWIQFLLLVILVESLSSTIAQDGRCTKQVSRVVYETQTYSRSSTQTYYEKCGFLNLLRCTRYRTVYSIGSRQLSRIGYETDYECCKGWITDGDNCLPTTPPTTEPLTTTTDPTTTATTTPLTTASQSTSRGNSNNGDTQRHARTWTSTTTMTGSVIEPTADFVGGRTGGSSSLLSNRGMMMGVAVVSVVVFLAMLIGGVVCVVRKLCPKKKPAGRLENVSTMRRDSEGVQVNGMVTSGVAGHGARPKTKQKVKGHRGKGVSNPSYYIVDQFTQESSYEAIDSEEGPLKPHKVQSDAKGFECVRMSDLKSAPAIRLSSGLGKDRRPSAPAVVTENEYTAFEDEEKTSPEPPPRNTAPKDNKILGTGESNIGIRKPLPMPKPQPKTRRNLPPGGNTSNTYAPPAASSHLVVPKPIGAQYLDMSKGQMSSPPSVDRRSGDKDGVSPRKPVMTKFPSLEESPKSSIEDCSQGLRAITSVSSSGNDKLYDHVDESRSEPTSRRGSDANNVFPAQGMYVHPRNLSPAIARKPSNLVADEKITCTYVLGNQVPGLAPPRSPLFSDSYDLVGISGCSNPDIAQDSSNDLTNPYDLVATPENRRKMLEHVITKSGYATPRQDSIDQDNCYENHRRSTASLPNSSRKLSLPVQNYGDDDVYDLVEVRDSHSMTTGRPPKVAPKKPVKISGEELQKVRGPIERSRSGPSLLQCAELNSVYENTSRF